MRKTIDSRIDLTEAELFSSRRRNREYYDLDVPQDTFEDTLKRFLFDIGERFRVIGKSRYRRVDDDCENPNIEEIGGIYTTRLREFRRRSEKNDSVNLFASIFQEGRRKRNESIISDQTPLYNYNESFDAYKGSYPAEKKWTTTYTYTINGSSTTVSDLYTFDSFEFQPIMEWFSSTNSTIRNPIYITKPSTKWRPIIDPIPIDLVKNRHANDVDWTPIAEHDLHVVPVNDSQRSVWNAFMMGPRINDNPTEPMFRITRTNSHEVGEQIRLEPRDFSTDITPVDDDRSLEDEFIVALHNISNRNLTYYDVTI